MHVQRRFSIHSYLSKKTCLSYVTKSVGATHKHIVIAICGTEPSIPVTKEEVMFYSDQPIESNYEDQLGRASFAKLLAQSFLNLYNQDTFSVGLFGK